MGHLQLTVQPRSDFGSAASRRLRKQGLVPGVLYQKGEGSIAFQLGEREIRRLLLTEGARTAVIDLRVGDGAARPALLKEWQVEPVKGQILHVDLAEVDLRETIQAPVSVVLVGQSVGVRDGGVLDQPHSAVTVEALPDALPDHLELDVTELAVGDTAHVSDLVAPAGVRIVDDPETVLASVTTASPVAAEEGEEGEPELVGGGEPGE
ncbi:MAG: 50S ribosomal protein L25 [Actinomycetota bacterium]